MFIALITLHKSNKNHNHEQEKGHKTAKNLCEWKFVRREIFAVQFRVRGEKEQEDTCDLITNRVNFSTLTAFFLW
jgi:hypothetical protein